MKKNLLKQTCYWLCMALVFFSCSSSSNTVPEPETPVKPEPGSTATTLLGKEILPHPRLLFTAADEKRVPDLIASEPLCAQLHTALIKEADRLLTAPMEKYITGQMIHLARRQINRCLTLGMAYRLTGEAKYALAGERELINICNFPSWNPSHYLDVAELTAAVSIGYDWLYGFLSPNTRQKVVSNIKSKALDLAVKEYATGDEYSWAKKDNNWNVVCNGGMVLGALAIAESDPKLAEKVITEAVKYAPNCLKLLGPDGIWYEGPQYWGYTNVYLAVLSRALEDNFGNSFGLMELPGVDKTMDYYIHTLAPSGRPFNFADADRETPPWAEPFYFYFAKKFNQPEVAYYGEQDMLKWLKEKTAIPRYFFLGIPWYQKGAKETKALPKLQVYKGDDAIIAFNGDRNVPGSIYLAAKAGVPDMAHAQMDCGTFVLETNGMRWTDDLGPDNYSLPGYFNRKPEWGFERWNYFRNTNFSHNTLTIDGKLQNIAGKAILGDYDAQSAQPWAKMNLSSLYTPQAQSAVRTFQMLNDKEVEVTDEIQLKAASSKVRWQIITQATVQCNGNRATLTQGGKKFILTIEQPSGAVFASEPAHTLTPQENPVEGYTLVYTTLTNSAKQTIKVRLSSAD